MLADLNVIDSPAQNLRGVFDLMPVATADDWATVADAPRRDAGSDSTGYRQSLRAAAARTARCPPVARSRR